jgi:hypothetical protein
MGVQVDGASGTGETGATLGWLIWLFRYMRKSKGVGSLFFGFKPLVKRFDSDLSCESDERRKGAGSLSGGHTPASSVPHR